MAEVEARRRGSDTQCSGSKRGVPLTMKVSAKCISMLALSMFTLWIVAFGVDGKLLQYEAGEVVLSRERTSYAELQ